MKGEQWTMSASIALLVFAILQRCFAGAIDADRRDRTIRHYREIEQNGREFISRDVIRSHAPSDPDGGTVAMTTPVRRMRSDEEHLLQLLFGDYNQFARPVLNSSDTVTVAIQFSLMHIKDLDIRSQILTTTGLLILEWTDERLTWSPEEHNGMSEIIIEAKALWKPEFAVINGAEKIYEEYNQFRAVVSHLGLVHWEPGGVFKTMCEIDITYYPFDEQRCQLTFGAWSYHTAKMNLTTSTATVNLDSYKKNGEWEILTTAAQRNEFSYECCPKEKFSNVAFTVYLRRRHLFYVMNVIMPSIMTSVLLLSIFFCTPAQKVQIGVVVLLSFRIFLLNVAGNIPKTSDHIPLLVIYLTCTLAITTMSMVLTVLVLNLYGIADRPVPGWVKSLVLTCLARSMGMCQTSHAYGSESTPPPTGPGSRQRRRSNRGSLIRCRFFAPYETGRRGTDGLCLENRRGGQRGEVTVTAAAAAADDAADAIIEVNRHHVTASDQSETADLTCGGGNHDAHHVVDYGSATSSSMATTAALIDDVTTEKNDDNDVTSAAVDYAKDWKRVAEVFDRFFFWLFLLAVILSTVILFHPLIK